MAVLSSARAEAPAPTVTVKLARPNLVLGVDTEVVVTVEVSGPGAAGFVPSRTFATVGTLEAPRPTETAGRFTARYLPPAERFPQVALLAVELASGSQRVRGVARLPLHGNTELPLRSSPGASVTLRVADRTFGPVAADRQGHVRIPIEVPPGVRTGVARAVDRTGSLRETEVDLQPAPFHRVLVIAPPTVEVGSFVEVTVVAVDPAGEPVAPARLSLRVPEGLVHPLGSALPGEARFLVEAPRRVGVGTLVLTGVAAGAPLGRADVVVPLRAGRPRTLTLSSSTRRLVVGSGGVARIVISAHDQFGNPTSAEGAAAQVDRQAASVVVTPGGQGVLTIPAPPRYEGHDRLTVEVSLGSAHAAQEIPVSGGPPADLTLEVSQARFIADGNHGVELRVRAADRNGTPTLVPGLSWETPGGYVRRVRMPRQGEYVAEFVPDRAQVPHRESVAVMASQALRAAATVDVTPPPARLSAAARVGVFTNLGHAAGPAAFIEATTPMRVRGARFLVGVTAGYLRDDLTGSGGAGAEEIPVRLVIDQVPVLALLRYRLSALPRPEIAFDVAAGVSFAHTRIGSTPGPTSIEVDASARAVALQAGAEAAFPLKPGRLVVGLRYLWISLGRTSHGDDVNGNSAGLLGDLGYRLTW